MDSNRKRPFHDIATSPTLLSTAHDHHYSELKLPSPALSSPPVGGSAKSKKMRVEGVTTPSSCRINGNVTLQDIIQSLADRLKSGDITQKPPYSYAILIAIAILQTDNGKMTLSQIYQWIATHFPYYKLKDSGWQNSIRHNLSLNEAFMKAEKSLDGKGHYWTIKEGFQSKFFKDIPTDSQEMKRFLQQLKPLFKENISPTQLPSYISTPPVYSQESDLNSSPMGFNLDSIPTIDTTPDTRLHSYVEDPVFTLSDSTPFKPLALKKSNTTLGFSDSINNVQIPKYSCSFNSSFDITSPSLHLSNNHALTTRYTNLSTEIDRNQSQMAHNDFIELSNGHFDLLKTPKQNYTNIQENVSLQANKTPSIMISSPNGNYSSNLKSLQTPSHLFEDLYCSPLSRKFETYSPSGNEKPIQAKKSCSVDDINTPYRHAFNNNTIIKRRTRHSFAGLFGVDICTVLEKASNINGTINNCS